MCNDIHVCIYTYHTSHIDIQYYDRGLSLCPTSPMLPVLALFHPLAPSTFMAWQGDWVGGLGGGERSKRRSYAYVQLHKTKQAHAIHTYSYTYEYSCMYTYSHTYVFTCMCMLTCENVCACTYTCAPPLTARLSIVSGPYRCAPDHPLLCMHAVPHPVASNTRISWVRLCWEHGDWACQKSQGWG